MTVRCLWRIAVSYIFNDDNFGTNHFLKLEVILRQPVSRILGISAPRQTESPSEGLCYSSRATSLMDAASTLENHMVIPIGTSEPSDPRLWWLKARESMSAFSTASTSSSPTVVCLGKPAAAIKKIDTFDHIPLCHAVWTERRADTYPHPLELLGRFERLLERPTKKRITSSGTPEHA